MSFCLGQEKSPYPIYFILFYFIFFLLKALLQAAQVFLTKTLIAWFKKNTRPVGSTNSIVNRC